MRKLDISPEAYNDLESIKEYLDSEFGEKEEKKRLRAIIYDLKRLQKYPETDIKLFERFGIITDYKCHQQLWNMVDYDSIVCTESINYSGRRRVP